MKPSWIYLFYLFKQLLVGLPPDQGFSWPSLQDVYAIKTPNGICFFLVTFFVIQPIPIDSGGFFRIIFVVWDISLPPCIFRFIRTNSDRLVQFLGSQVKSPLHDIV